MEILNPFNLFLIALGVFLAKLIPLLFRKFKDWKQKRKEIKIMSGYDFTNHTYLGKKVMINKEIWQVCDFTMQGNLVILKSLDRINVYLKAELTAEKPKLEQK